MNLFGGLALTPLYSEGSRHDSFTEARTGVCPIPSWEGWPKAGVGCPGPTGVPGPHPAATRHPSKEGIIYRG